MPSLYSALEDSLPEEAIKLYTDACTILEEDGGDQMSFDLYRASASVYIKHEKWVLEKKCECTFLWNVQYEEFICMLLYYVKQHKLITVECWKI